MDYEANAEQQKRRNNLYSDFTFDIFEFNKFAGEIITSKVEDRDQEFKSKCKRVCKILDQMVISAPEIKDIFRLFEETEVTGTATRI